MSTLDVVGLVAEVIILLLLLYLVFLKSYFQEKGKNLATKEDVAEITSKVESIRSELQFSLQARLSWRAEEHNALVDYYSKYGAWLTGITNVSFSGDDAASLVKIRSELSDLERDLDLASSRMELFVQNEDILLQKARLKIETLQFHAHAVSESFSFGRRYLEVQEMKLETPRDQQLERYTVLLDQQRDAYQKFKEAQKELFTAIWPKVVDHRSTISGHLKNLLRPTIEGDFGAAR